MRQEHIPLTDAVAFAMSISGNFDINPVEMLDCDKNTAYTICIHQGKCWETRNVFKVISHPDAFGNSVAFEHLPGNKKSLFEQWRRPWFCHWCQQFLGFSVSALIRWLSSSALSHRAPLFVRQPVCLENFPVCLPSPSLSYDPETELVSSPASTQLSAPHNTTLVFFS